MSDLVPKVGVGGILLDGSRVLLVRRGKDPGKGLWSIPGGKLKWGETLHQGVAREVCEETGLVVRVESLAGITEVRFPAEDPQPQFHYILIDFFCSPVSGELVCSDDAEEAAWFDLSQLDKLPTTEGLSEKLQKWITSRQI